MLVNIYWYPIITFSCGTGSTFLSLSKHTNVKNASRHLTEGSRDREKGQSISTRISTSTDRSLVNTTVATIVINEPGTRKQLQKLTKGSVKKQADQTKVVKSNFQIWKKSLGI